MWTAETTIAWLLTFALHSTALVGATALLARTRLLRAARARDRAWKLALVAGIATASFQVAVGAGPAIGRLGAAPIPPPPVAPVAEAENPSSRVVVLVPELAVASGAGAEATAGVDRERSDAGSIPWAAAAVLGWGLAGAGLALRRAIQMRRYRRSLEPRRPVVGGPGREVLDRLVAETGRGRRVRLTRSAALTSPVALGGREICLPERALTELDRAELEGLLAHELAHLERRDPAWLTALGVLEAVFFFQPLLGRGRRAGGAAAEEACDERAVELTGRSDALARCLVRVAGWVRGARPAAVVAGMAEPGSGLERRIERVLAPRSTAGWAGRGGTALGLALALAVACGGPGVRPGADEPSPPAAVEPTDPAGPPADPEPPVATDDREVARPPAPIAPGRPLPPPERRSYVWIGPDGPVELDFALPPLFLERLGRIGPELEERLGEIDEEIARHLEGLDVEIESELEGLGKRLERLEIPIHLDGPGRLRVTIEGSVEIENGRIERIEPGGRLEIVDRREDVERRLEATSGPGGEPVLALEVEGEPRPMSAADERWLAEILDRWESGQADHFAGWLGAGPYVHLRVDPRDRESRAQATDRLRRRIQALESEIERLQGEVDRLRGES